MSEHGTEHSPEQVKKQVKVYLMVFGALLVLTVITVLVSQLHFTIALAVGVGLLIALIKGGLVASFFMHLNSEKRWIYGVLILTAVFFVFLFVLPLTTSRNTFGKPIHYDSGGPDAALAAGDHAGEHGGEH
jgi:cytochrome c oxidase subunit 4